MRLSSILHACMRRTLAVTNHRGSVTVCRQLHGTCPKWRDVRRTFRYLPMLYSNLACSAPQKRRRRAYMYARWMHLCTVTRLVPPIRARKCTAALSDLCRSEQSSMNKLKLNVSLKHRWSSCARRSVHNRFINLKICAIYFGASDYKVQS